MPPLRTLPFYNYIFCGRLFDKINKSFQPNAYVVQCGADCLIGDPLGGFNLTSDGMAACIKLILSYADNKPCLFLGGGGYNRANAARYWTTLTSVIINEQKQRHCAENTISLTSDIPECDPFFSLYGPSFELDITKGNRINENKEDEVSNIIKAASGM